MSKPGYSADRGATGADLATGLGVSALSALIMRRKAFFLLPIACALSGVTAIHYWLPVYEARVSLIAQTVGSSTLQAVTARMASMGVQEDELQELQRFVARLTTQSFYLRVAQELRRKNVDLAMFHTEMRSTRFRIYRGIVQFLPFLPFHMAETSMKDVEDEDMAAIISGYTTIAVAGTDRISILVRNGDRFSAGEVANTIADVAVKVLLAEGLKDLDDAHAYVEVQAKQLEKGIHEIGDELNQLRIRSGMALEEGGESDTSQAGDIQRQLTEATLAQEENNQHIAKLTAEMEQIKRQPSSATNASIDPENRYGLPQKINELKKARNLISLRQTALNHLLHSMMNSAYVGNGEKAFELHKRMDFEFSIYEALRKQTFELDMKRIGANNKVHVSDYVRPFGAKRSDNLPTKLLMALILSLFSGLPVAALWELAWLGVRTGRDLTDAGLAYLGGIPLVTGRFARDQRLHGPKICRFDSDSEVAMAFIQIRSRLLHLSDRKEIANKVIGVISAHPSEGKSFFSRNLAACFGHMGHKTLLLDCDLRKAMTSDYFEMLGEHGIGEILTGTTKFGDVVRRQLVRGVDFVPAGQIKSNITDLFATAAFGNLLKDLREFYDYIILDTPSMIAVPDAPLILRSADIPMLVAAMNITTPPDLQLAMDRIRALYAGDVYAALNRVTGGQVPLYLINTGGKRGGGNLFGNADGGARV